MVDRHEDNTTLNPIWWSDNDKDTVISHIDDNTAQLRKVAESSKKLQETIDNLQKDRKQSNRNNQAQNKAEKNDDKKDSDSDKDKIKAYSDITKALQSAGFKELASALNEGKSAVDKLSSVIGVAGNISDFISKFSNVLPSKSSESIHDANDVKSAILSSVQSAGNSGALNIDKAIDLVAKTSFGIGGASAGTSIDNMQKSIASSIAGDQSEQSYAIANAMNLMKLPASGYNYVDDNLIKSIKDIKVPSDGNWIIGADGKLVKIADAASNASKVADTAAGVADVAEVASKPGIIETASSLLGKAAPIIATTVGIADFASRQLQNATKQGALNGGDAYTGFGYMMDDIGQDFLNKISFGLLGRSSKDSQRWRQEASANQIDEEDWDTFSGNQRWAQQHGISDQAASKYQRAFSDDIDSVRQSFENLRGTADSLNVNFESLTEQAATIAEQVNAVSTTGMSSSEIGDATSAISDFALNAGFSEDQASTIAMNSQGVKLYAMQLASKNGDDAALAGIGSNGAVALQYLMDNGGSSEVEKALNSTAGAIGQISSGITGKGADYTRSALNQNLSQSLFGATPGGPGEAGKQFNMTINLTQDESFLNGTRKSITRTLAQDGNGDYTDINAH